MTDQEMIEQGWSGWHKSGGLVALFGVITQIKAMQAATPDGGADPYLSVLGIACAVLAAMLVTIGCYRWEWVEYDEDGEPVTAGKG